MTDKEKGLTEPRLIINLLLEGNALTAKVITEKICEKSGKDIQIEDVEIILSRMCDSTKCTLGYFIERKKVGKGLTYSFVEEVLNLSEQNLFELYLTNGDNHYDLEQALDDYPELARHVISTSNLEYDMGQDMDYEMPDPVQTKSSMDISDSVESSRPQNAGAGKKSSSDTLELLKRLTYPRQKCPCTARLYRAVRTGGQRQPLRLLPSVPHPLTL